MISLLTDIYHLMLIPQSPKLYQELGDMAENTVFPVTTEVADSNSSGWRLGRATRRQSEHRGGVVRLVIWWKNPAFSVLPWLTSGVTGYEELGDMVEKRLFPHLENNADRNSKDSATQRASLRRVSEATSNRHD